MAVESFLQPSESKITVEKLVKEKPTISDLTTIESPGKPSPASLLENNSEKKNHRRTRKEKATAIDITKKDHILIITEKPQAAQKIALALGDAKKYSEDSVSYYELIRNNKKIYVASAVGHLFNLNYKKGQKGWPIFDLEWTPSFEKKNSAFTKKYYSLLKKLAKQSKEFIVATDYDIEGEVIGWNVLRFICNQETAKRMKFSTLTKPELENAYDYPLPELDWGQAYAGESRHILDWLYGINLSRALMSAIKKTGSFKILSIGRVQGPTLKIIVDREHEISSFKSVPYWQIFAFLKNYKDLKLKHQKDIFKKEELPKFENLEGKEANAETTEKQEKIPPQPPFDLTSLQREAYRLYRFSPSQTLSTAQKLYLDGLISYPRTSSQKIPSSIEPKRILKALEKHFPEAKLASRNTPVEGKKSDPAHPSIYPTGEFNNLEGAEKKLYELIVKKFISVFMPDAITINKKINVKTKNKKNEEIDFNTSGLHIEEKGWTKVYPTILEEISIPTINGKVKIEKINIEEKETQPPKRYTPTSLLTLLEKKNLGTKATRSSIIDTLFDRGYLDGTSIKATALGIKLIETLEKYSSIIIDENLTRQLEDEMEKIQIEKAKPKDYKKYEQRVVEKAKKIIEDISKEFKSKEDQIGASLAEAVQDHRKEQRKQNELMLCPTCKKGNLRILFNRASRRYFVACSAYPECKQTYSLPPNALIKKTDNDKFCEFDQFPKLLAIRKGKRPWEFCFNPNCEIEKKKREEWNQNKNEEE